MSNTFLRRSLVATVAAGLTLFGLTPSASAETLQFADLKKMCETFEGARTGFTNVAALYVNKGAEVAPFVMSSSADGEPFVNGEPLPVPAGEERDPRTTFGPANGENITVIVTVDGVELDRLELNTADCAVPAPPPPTAPADVVVYGEWSDVGPADCEARKYPQSRSVTTTPYVLVEGEPVLDTENAVVTYEPRTRELTTEEYTALCTDEGLQGEAPAPNPDSGSNPVPSQGTDKDKAPATGQAADKVTTTVTDKAADKSKSTTLGTGAPRTGGDGDNPLNQWLGFVGIAATAVGFVGWRRLRSES